MQEPFEPASVCKPMAILLNDLVKLHRGLAVKQAHLTEETGSIDIAALIACIEAHSMRFNDRLSSTLKSFQRHHGLQQLARSTSRGSIVSMHDAA